MANSFSLVIFLESLNMGGAERQALNLAKGLMDRNIKVKVIVLGPAGNAIEEFNKAKVSWECLGLVLYSTHPAIIKRNTKAIRKAIKGNKATHILPFTYWPNLYVNLARKPKHKDIRFYWNQRDIGLHFGKHEEELRLIREASAVIGNSSACIQAIEDFYDVELTNSMVIRNGVLIMEPTQQPVNRPLKALMVANINKNKDHHTLISAWGQLFRELGEKCPVLQLAGAKRDTFDHMSALVADEGLSDRVKFLGMVDNVPELIAQSDIAVFSSRNEGSPNGLLECMAGGLPVVATDIPAIREALDDRDSLFQPGNATDLAEKVKKIVVSEEFRQQKGQASKKIIDDNYSFKGMIEAYIQMFRT